MNRQVPGQPMMTVQGKDLETLRCQRCQSATFFPVYRVVYMSHIQAPDGQAKYGHVQVGWECSNNHCGARLDVEESREANRLGKNRMLAQEKLSHDGT